VPGARQDAQFGLEAVEVAPRELLASSDVGHEALDLTHRAVGTVAPLSDGWWRSDAGERVHERVDRGLSVERCAPPGRREVAPLRQLPRRAAQAATRAVVRRATVSRLAKRAAHTRPRVGELVLEPALEDAREVTARDVLGRHLESRIHPGLDGSLAQQLGTEGVNGPDARHLELGKRVLEPPAVLGRSGRVLSLALDRGAEAELQLTRRRVGEGDGHHA